MTHALPSPQEPSPGRGHPALAPARAGKCAEPWHRGFLKTCQGARLLKFILWGSHSVDREQMFTMPTMRPRLGESAPTSNGNSSSSVGGNVTRFVRAWGMKATQVVSAAWLDAITAWHPPDESHIPVVTPEIGVALCFQRSLVLCSLPVVMKKISFSPKVWGMEKEVVF